MGNHPSSVPVTLKGSEWKSMISFLATYASDPAKIKRVQFAQSVTQVIKVALQPISDQSELSITFSPSVLLKLLIALKPDDGMAFKKDSNKETKESILGVIQNSLSQAREAIMVTTVDIKEDYQVVGPVYVQVSNKGLFNNQLNELTAEYNDELKRMQSSGQFSKHRMDWSFLYGEWSVGQSHFEQAFFVAVQELKKRALFLNADGVIGMRQDIDLDTSGFQFFYLQMYGTAVKFRS